MTTRVLAIDDSRTIRDMLRACLETAGYDFSCAQDGVEGVERFSDHPADVVITDINMPRMDGFGVIRSLRSGPMQRLSQFLF